MPRWPGRAQVRLHGKRILLTGASSGIGAVAAEKFAAEGATVIAVARREHLLRDVVERIIASGGIAVAIPTDLADLAQVDELVKTVGPVDILINNAARSIRRPLSESLRRWHDIERVMQLNYYAPLRLIRGLAPGMIERGDGHIINIATWRVLPESSPLFAAYNASKAALSAISRVIDTEWGALGVHSTTVYYPLVATPMIAPTRAYAGVLRSPRTKPPTGWSPPLSPDPSASHRARRWRCAHSNCRAPRTQQCPCARDQSHERRRESTRRISQKRPACFWFDPHRRRESNAA